MIKIRDANGREIKIGDMIRIIGVPDLSKIDIKARKECLSVFQHLVGKYKRVSGFDQYHCVEILFKIKKGKPKGLHGVAIEPKLVKIKSKK